MSARTRRRCTRARHAPEARARRAAERARLATVLRRYRSVEWDSQRDVVATDEGGELSIPRPVYKRRVGSSPLVEAPTPKPRVRARGTYTRELVRATTRGHDHVPVRPDA